MDSGSSVQHGPDNRLLLDDPDRPVHPVRRDLQDRVRHAEEERGEAAQDAVDGGAERGRDVGDGGPGGRHRHLQDPEHAAQPGQAQDHADGHGDDDHDDGQRRWLRREGSRG